MSDRDLDIVVFGATGVTGRRVAAYLAERSAETGLRWAAAVRNPDKLLRLLDEEGVQAPQTLAAELSDARSLAAMAARTRVVLNLVGPYTLYGRPVIAACVQSGAHYADLTGEIPFVRRMIDEFDRPAVAAGVKVVQVCGFEAVPPDLLTLVASERAREQWEEGLAAVDLEVSVKPPPGLPRPSDGISGGTFQSLAAVAGADDAGLIADPASLIDNAAVAAAVRRISPIALAPRRAHGDTVIAPMAPAAFINPPVIQRSAELIATAERRPPEPFRYREGVVLGGHALSLPARFALAGALSATQAGLRGIARAGPGVRRPAASLLSRLGPHSGYGPAADRLRGWKWTMAVQARTAGGRQLRLQLEADGHPGYLTTARLLGEAGMLLAEEGATPERAGCLTPAAALGSAQIARFERAGMRVAEAAPV